MTQEFTSNSPALLFTHLIAVPTAVTSCNVRINRHDYEQIDTHDTCDKLYLI